MLPMPDGGAAEAALTADVNAERVERIRRFPRLRDQSIFVGNPQDVVTASLGPGLPTAHEFARERYAFTGYITGFDPPADRHALRAELGYRADERICLVAVGGSGVGGHLLRRVAERRAAGKLCRSAYVASRTAEPRCHGCRCPTASMSAATVPDLHRHLSACDMAVGAGG